MVLFNYSTKELTAKVVYYGPGLCGKTTNLQWIHEKLPIKNKGKMLSLATETDRTLFFDFLPIEIGTIRGMRTRIQLYTVPGQVFYNATRRMVLKGADCLVFVCDSQEPMLDANIESFENMRQNLEANEIDPDESPLVFQYNKRDLPNALPLEIINERMNPKGNPFYEAVALKGLGVEETLKGVTKLVFKSLSVKYGEGSGPFPAISTARPAAPPAAQPSAAPPPGPANAPAPPQRPKAATATIPPGHGRPVAQSPAAPNAEDMLEELDLEPTVDFEEPVPAAASKPHNTLVTSRREAEDLRRRIGMPAALDLDRYEPEDMEGDELDEISFDENPLSGLDALPEPDGEPQLDFEAPPPPHRVPSPPLRAAPPELRSGNPVKAGRSNTAEVVTVDIEPGQREVTVPVEIALEPGSGPVTLNLKIVLRPRR
jgi:signal recognition particle receptor subunit beta